MSHSFANRSHDMDPAHILKEIVEVNKQLSTLNDVDAILDRILSEVRRMTGADAGTIFLVDEGKLKFSYVHNDSLMQDGVNKEIYSNFSMPINDKSIVGYVAHHGEQLVIDDAYNLPADLPFSFNKAFDDTTGYRTTSILTTPITTSQSEVAGVIQLINSKGDSGRFVPFPKTAQDFLPLFAANASIAIERGIMTRELILRMMRMAELRDPSETGAHVQRVGAYSAEIFHDWAMKKGLPKDEIKRRKDLIRVAAMLHDVGKVGISDKILKKPAKLDEDEYRLMRYHTVFGGQLFAHSTSELDALSGAIAIGHHEKWNGTGYPGTVDNVFDPEQPMDHPRKGEQIEIEARICALADVFDALSSRRSYKPPWPDEKIISVIKGDSGTHFDPEVVESFLDIFEVITAIRDKYTEDLPPEEKPNPTGEAAQKAADAQDKERGADPKNG